MSEPPEYGPIGSSNDPVSYEELAWLLADQLSEAQQAALRARMDKDPTTSDKLARMSGVDSLFDPPAPMKVIGPMPTASIEKLDEVLDALLTGKEPHLGAGAAAPSGGAGPADAQNRDDDDVAEAETRRGSWGPGKRR